MRKIHGQKQAVAWTLAGALTSAVTGGLVLYGAVKICRELIKSVGGQRVVRLIRAVVQQTVADAQNPSGAETVFQADAASSQEPGWTPHNPRGTNLYGPN